MKYNSVENAKKFIADQIAWCRSNGYENFTIWSNGKELQARVDDFNAVYDMQEGELFSAGWWKAIIFENSNRIK